MEEKNVTKISLSTFFLILAIILIVVMGIFIFKLYTQRDELTQKSIKQDEKISALQNNVDDLTSELNKISTSNSTENATNNNINSNTTTTEEKRSNIQHDLSNYIGLWKKSTSNDYLYVHSINNNEITFDFDYNGKNIGEHNKATLNGNTASFYIKDGNNSLDGKITLENKNIIIHITNSTFENVTKGTHSFTDYLGLQN